MSNNQDIKGDDNTIFGGSVSNSIINIGSQAPSTPAPSAVTSRRLPYAVIVVAVLMLAGLVTAFIIRNTDRATRQPSAIDSQTETIAEVYGYVCDGDQKAIQGAEVKLDEFPAIPVVETAADGMFHLTGIPQTYNKKARLSIVKQGYMPYSEYVPLDEASPPFVLRKGE